MSAEWTTAAAAAPPNYNYNFTTLAAASHSLLAAAAVPVTDEETPELWQTWTFGLLIITAASVLSPTAILMVPLLSDALYERCMVFLVALGIGAMSGSCVFILIPQAFNVTEVTKFDYVTKSWLMISSLYMFFLVDRILQCIIEFRRRSHNRHKVHASTIDALLARTRKKSKTQQQKSAQQKNAYHQQHSKSAANHVDKQQHPMYFYGNDIKSNGKQQQQLSFYDSNNNKISESQQIGMTQQRHQQKQQLQYFYGNSNNNKNDDKEQIETKERLQGYGSSNSSSNINSDNDDDNSKTTESTKLGKDQQLAERIAVEVEKQQRKKGLSHQHSLIIDENGNIIDNSDHNSYSHSHSNSNNHSYYGGGGIAYVQNGYTSGGAPPPPLANGNLNGRVCGNYGNNGGWATRENENGDKNNGNADTVVGKISTVNTYTMDGDSHPPPPPPFNKHHVHHHNHLYRSPNFHPHAVEAAAAPHGRATRAATAQHQQQRRQTDEERRDLEDEVEVAMINNALTRSFSTRKNFVVFKEEKPDGFQFETDDGSVYSVSKDFRRGSTPAIKQNGGTSRKLSRKEREMEIGVEVHQKVVIEKSRLEVASVAYMILFGSSANNFVDGMSTGAAFSDSILRGITIGLAVISQQFPQELGTLAILIKSGLGVRRTLLFNMLPIALSYVGFAFGVFLDNVDDSYDSFIFSISAGMYFYIFLGTLIPEIRESFNATLKRDVAEAALCTALQFSGIGFGVSFLYMMN